MDLSAYKVADVVRWLEIRETVGRPMPDTVAELLIDMGHSSLLARLASGLPPLPDPPPVAFSYPQYAWAETGEGTPFEVRYDAKRGELLVDQCWWRVFEILSHQEWLVGYYAPRRSQTVHPSRWRVWRTGEANGRATWALKRITAPPAPAEGAPGLSG